MFTGRNNNWNRVLQRENDGASAPREIFNGPSNSDGPNQRITGTKGADRLKGGDGNDRIAAGRGNDLIIDSAGGDTVNGGKGFDTAFFYGDRSDYDIVFKGRKILVTKDRQTDVLVKVEALKFGSDPESSDATTYHVKRRKLVEQDPEPDPGGTGQTPGTTVNGTRGADRLEGGAGDDRISAGRGNDEIIDSGGSDNVNGGRGFDTAFFFGDRSDYDIVFKGRSILVSKDGETDVLTRIEALKFGSDPDSSDATTYHVKRRKLVEQDPEPDPGGNDPSDPNPPLSLGEFEAEVLRLTNEFRIANGRDPLRTDDRLTDLAEDWSFEMARGDFFKHSSTRAELAQRDYDWQTWGENIAAGYSTPRQVVDAWIDSPGHRKNMLKDGFQEIGIGHYYLENDTGRTNYNHYWTQVFGTERGDEIA